MIAKFQLSSDCVVKMEIFNGIKAVAMDVDGVLTDNGFWWGVNGEEMKRFCFADVTGISRALSAGIQIALISGESSPSGMGLVQRFADKLKISHVYKGCHDKAAAIREFASRVGVDLQSVCYIGDDVIDIPAMELVGLAVAPPNAHIAVRKKVAHITELAGGYGAVREVLDLVIQNSSRDRSA